VHDVQGFVKSHYGCELQNHTYHHTNCSITKRETKKRKEDSKSEEKHRRTSKEQETTDTLYSLNQVLLKPYWENKMRIGETEQKQNNES
jgi:hypothetical protein